MSLLATRLAMTHRAVIERATAAADEWGNPGPPEWDAHLEEVPCRVKTAAGRELAGDDTTVVIEDLRLLVLVGTDVTETDRVGNITYRGDVLVAGPTQIRAVLRHKDHLELVLVRVA